MANSWTPGELKNFKLEDPSLLFGHLAQYLGSDKRRVLSPCITFHLIDWWLIQVEEKPFLMVFKCVFLLDVGPSWALPYSFMQPLGPSMVTLVEAYTARWEVRGAFIDIHLYRTPLSTSFIEDWLSWSWRTWCTDTTVGQLTCVVTNPGSALLVPASYPVTWLA